MKLASPFFFLVFDFWPTCEIQKLQFFFCRGGGKEGLRTELGVGLLRLQHKLLCLKPLPMKLVFFFLSPWGVRLCPRSQTCLGMVITTLPAGTHHAPTQSSRV